MITSICFNTIIRSKKLKKKRFDITNVSLKEFSKIIKEFEDYTYEGYARNSSKHMPTDSYFYLSRNIENCMMIFNMGVVSIRTQMTSTQKMNNSKRITQNIPNLHFCSSNESE